MALRDIIGQERAVRILRGFMQRERVPHALLFAGDDGIGKHLTAINFAKALNCQGSAGHASYNTNNTKGLFTEETEVHRSEAEPENRFDACDECPSCRKIDSGNHPDVMHVGSEGEGGQITIGSVRGVGEALSLKPFEAAWKVVIIDTADRLNQAAANAFLQTLEEPSGQSLLILVSSRPEKLLGTIRSRCQRINFSPLPPDMMSRLIQERFKDMNAEEASLLSVLSGGRIGFALNEDLTGRRDWSFGVIEQMLAGREEDAWESRDEMEEWFEWAQVWIRDVAVLIATGNTSLLINQDLAGQIQAVAKKAVLQDVLKLSRELYNIGRRLQFNLNRQLTLHYTGMLMRERLAVSR